MGLLATVATVVALGVGLSGYRNAPAAGMSEFAAAASLEEDSDPLSPRFLDQNPPIRVHVAGAVNRPGVYTLPRWARVVDAVKKAGGPAEMADLDGINLADRIQDGEQIRVPVRGRPERLERHAPTPEPSPLEATIGGRGTGRYPFAAGSKATPDGDGLLDLNSADQAALEALPGIGRVTAERILEHRAQHGPFLRVEDLMNVKGIGTAKFDRLAPRVTVR
jgi:competence protein ComEA